MDDKLLPRKVPEPTRFPSFNFEPCVPDASLVFGCGLFDASKVSTEVRKPSHEATTTGDFLHCGTRETGVPSWIKAYGVGKKTGVNTRGSQQSDHGRSLMKEGDKRTDVDVPRKTDAQNFSERTNSGHIGQESMCAGRKTGISIPETERGGHEYSATDLQEAVKSYETFGKSAINSLPENTGMDSFAAEFGYGIEGSKMTRLQTHIGISDYHSTERQGGITSLSQGLGGVAGKTEHLPQGTSAVSDVRDDTTPVALPKTGGVIGDVAERGGSLRGLADCPGGGTGYSHSSDRFTIGGTRDVTSHVSVPRQIRTFDFQKEENKFPEPQKGFISSDCSLTDYAPPESRRRKGKWKNVSTKESDPGSVPYEKVGKAAKERSPRAGGTPRSRDSPRRAKRRDPPCFDFRNAGAAEECAPYWDGAWTTVSDPLIRALFHLQNRHTEQLQKLAGDMGEVALKQKKMFDVFQRLQSAFCDSGAQPAAAAPEVKGGDRKRLCDKCTQTSYTGDGDQGARAVAVASTQTDNGRTSAASSLGGGVAAVDSCKGPEVSGMTICAGSEEAGRPAEKRPIEFDRLERREYGVRKGPDACTEVERAGENCRKVESPQAVRRLIRTVRNIAARVEDSGGKTRRPSQDAGSIGREAGDSCKMAEESRGDPCASSSQEVGGLIKAMRSLASRYKNNEFIKAPSLEDVVEASENSSDSEDGGASEVADESLTIGDLSLVPQNISLSPNQSLKIDSRGLEISSDALASGNDDSETEVSAMCSKEKGDHTGNTDSTAIYLYRNIITKVQEILEHSKTTSESRRDSLGNKPATSEPENGRMRTRSQ